MENYLTIVSRDQFINLYRFGNLNIHTNFIINEEYVLELLKLLQCEHDEDYLILSIKYTKKSTLGKIDILHNLKIQDLKSIYVLSEKAKNYYEPKFNPKLRFEIYSNLDILKQAQDYRELDDVDCGINILTKQFDFINKNKIEEELGKIFKNNILESYKNKNYLEIEYKSFYIDLVSYKRESFFPKKDVGYFFDLIVITVLRDRKPEQIKKFKQGNLAVESSNTYQKLKESDNKSLLEYIEFIKNTDDEDIKKFLEKTEGIKYVIIGVLFMMVQNILLEKEAKYNEKIHEIVNIFKKDYADELSISLYLIGIVFGYKELYDDYYSYISLDVFNDKKEDDNYNKTCLKIKNQELEDEIKELSQKLTDLRSELKTYREISDNTDITSETQIISDEKENIKQDAIESTVEKEEEKQSDIKLNKETTKEISESINSEVQDEFIRNEKAHKTDDKKYMVDISNYPFETLCEMYYRKDTNNRRIGKIRKEYKDERELLIKKIINDNLV